MYPSPISRSVFLPAPLGRRRLFACVLLALLGALHPLSASEETGPVLERLARSVENKLANLEASVRERGVAQEGTQATLAALKVAFEAADTEAARLEQKSLIVEQLAQLNAADRDLVTQTVSTLASVSRDLGELAQVFSTGKLGAEQLARQREQVRGVIRSIGPVLGVLAAGLDDPLAKQQAASTEQTLVMLYRQLEASSDLNPDGALAQIRSTASALQDVAAQLRIVHQLLDLERYQLQVVAKVSVGELLLSRMAEVRFGDHALIDLPQGFQQGVTARNRDFGRVLRSGLTAPNPARSRSGSDQAVMARIYSGEVP